VVQAKRTKQPPEVVEEVLRRYSEGAKPGEIADAMRLHHTTVKCILNNVRVTGGARFAGAASHLAF
jgi:DNA-directed RNA polymerase specialized sigma24 family protein